MRYTVLVQQHGDKELYVGIYGENGVRVAEKSARESVRIEGALRVSIVRGFSSLGVVAEYEYKPCIEEMGATLVVKKCGAGGGEE